MEKATVSTTRQAIPDTFVPQRTDLSSIESEISAELEILRKLKRDDLEKKNSDIQRMITYYDGMTNSMEERRNKIYDFTLQYLVILLTASGVLYSYKANITALVLAMLSAVLLIQSITALLIILTYELQSRYRYPFLRLREHGNRWKWFYYGNPYITKIDRNVYFPRYNDTTTTKPYLEGLKFLTSKYAKEKLVDEVSDNIQQLYLLIVHNYYKNKFYLNLVGIRLGGLVMSFVVAALVFIYWYAHPWLAMLCSAIK